MENKNIPHYLNSSMENKNIPHYLNSSMENKNIPHYLNSSKNGEQKYTTLSEQFQNLTGKS
jgi:hypothetical protein